MLPGADTWADRGIPSKFNYVPSTRLGSPRPGGAPASGRQHVAFPLRRRHVIAKPRAAADLRVELALQTHTCALQPGTSPFPRFVLAGEPPSHRTFVAGWQAGVFRAYFGRIFRRREYVAFGAYFSQYFAYSPALSKNSPRAHLKIPI